MFFTKLLEKFPILKNWRALALCATALLIAGFFFYLWAYGRGEAACQTGLANANTEATAKQAAANQGALGREMKAAQDRAKTHSDIARTITDAKDEDADSPAPDLDQRFYERLRALQRQEHGN